MSISPLVHNGSVVHLQNSAVKTSEAMKFSGEWVEVGHLERCNLDPERQILCVFSHMWLFTIKDQICVLHLECPLLAKDLFTTNNFWGKKFIFFNGVTMTILTQSGVDEHKLDSMAFVLFLREKENMKLDVQGGKG